MHARKIIKTVFAVVMMIAVMTTMTACNRETAERFFDFGTVIEIKLDGKKTKSTVDNIITRYNYLDKLFDAENTASDIYKINHAAADEIVAVDAVTYSLIELSKEMYEKTDGVFNIATYGLSVLWRFTSTTYSEYDTDYTPPAAEEIAAELNHCDMDDLVLLGGNKIKKLDGDLMIGFGAVAKGYAGDAAKADYIQSGQTGILNVGGTIFSVGDKCFNIGIGNPRDSSSDYFGKVTVPGGSVVCTSGDYYRYYEVDGVRYCHILGAGGYPASVDDIISVTVVSTNGTGGAMCDILSTAVFASGVQKGTELANEYGVSLIIIFNNNTYKTVNCGDGLFTLKDSGYTNV